MNNQNYCPNCGSELNGSNYCPNCGANANASKNGQSVQNAVGNTISSILGTGDSILSKYMFREEKWWQVMLLSMVTAGGYGVYYWYRQMREIKTIETRRQVENKIPFILFLLLYYASATIAGFVFVVIYYKRLVTVAKETFDVDLKPKNAYVYSLLMYVPFYSWYLSVKNHNKIIALYNDEKNPGQRAQRQTVDEYYKNNGNAQKRTIDYQKNDYIKKDTGTKDVVTQEHVKNNEVQCTVYSNNTTDSADDYSSINSNVSDVYTPVNPNEIIPDDDIISAIAGDLD